MSRRRLLPRLPRRSSLLARYSAIIVSAVLVLPLLLAVVGIATTVSTALMSSDRGDSPYRDPTKLRQSWEAVAASLGGIPEAEAASRLRDWQARYPQTRVFRIDAQGRLRESYPHREDLPTQWTASGTVEFMKKAVNGPIFTVVAFVGSGSKSGSSSGSDQGTGPTAGFNAGSASSSDSGEGFIVMEIPRELTKPYAQRGGRVSSTVYAVGVLTLLGVFLAVSFLFFTRIRRRLVRLQQAMEQPAGSGLPQPIEPSGDDEIGRLERSFSAMARQLEEGRQREAAEEELRRELIAKLSHDVRTPLTVIRAHAFSLEKEPLRESGRESLRVMTAKLDYLSQLMENLFSYNLLAAGKYPYRPARTDVARLAREQLAAWYPAFEQAGVELSSELEGQAVYWEVDPLWLERVLDNLLQNALRHAASGRFVEVRLDEREGGRLSVADRGPGMDAPSPGKGSGLGLQIVRLMLARMSLRLVTESGPGGTIVTIEATSYF